MADRPPPPDPHPTPPPRRWWENRRGHGFHHEVGFRIDPEATGTGYCTVRGRVLQRHLNINGVVHGGVYATMLDTAMGGSVVSLLGPGEVAATASLYVEFLRPAREHAELQARGEVLRRGRHLAFAEGNLTDGEGRRLSQARGTWYIWTEGEGAPAAASPRAGPARPPRSHKRDREPSGS